MTTQSTSREAYHSTERKRGSWEKAVLGVIRKYGPISDRAVAARLGRECGFVSARRNSLVDKGLVREMGVFVDPDTHIPVMLWAVV